jgi:hypothetical protein
VRTVGRVVRVVASNRDLRRVELAFLAFNAAEWGAWIAMLVYAYSRGGATEAGLVALAQLLPPRCSRRSPDGGRSSSATSRPRLRWRPRPRSSWRTGRCCSRTRAPPPRPPWVTVTRPAQAAVVPGLARTPDEPTAANVIANWVESASVLAAPALTGVLLAAASPGWVFVVMAAFAAFAAFAALVVHPLRAPKIVCDNLSQTLVGGRDLFGAPNVRLLVGLPGAEAVLKDGVDGRARRRLAAHTRVRRARPRCRPAAQGS